MALNTSVKTFILFFVCSFQVMMMSELLAQDQQADKERQKIEKFKNDTFELYRNLGLEPLVDFDSFAKGYMSFFLNKDKLNGKPLISYLNYSFNNNSTRFLTIDFMEKRVVLKSLAAHGVNSACQTSCKNSRCCSNTWGKSAIAFSNENGTYKSSLGLMIAGEKNYSRIVHENLMLRGLEPFNSNLESRGIRFHTVHNRKFSGLSLGCIVLPPNEFWKAYNKLANKTLIYTFQGSSVRSYEGFQDEELLKKAVKARESTGLMSVPEEVPTVPDRTIADSKAANAKSSLGSISYSEPGAFTGKAMIGDSSSEDKLPIPDKVGEVTILKGSKKFEECQMLSDSSWKETVAFINSGGNPAERFKGQWIEFDKWIAENGIPDGDAADYMQQRMATINDCVAMAHISNRTDFDKPNINQPETKSTADGKITCVYRGPESQDYQDCLKTIAAHDALLAAEAKAHANQQTNYQSVEEARVAQVKARSATLSNKGTDTQGNILDQAKSVTADHATIAQERADISADKILQLKAVASQIPTKDSLYDECIAKFNKHGTIGTEDFNDVSSIYSKTETVTFNSEKDYCQAAVSPIVQPIHNQKAREEVKAVLNRFGEEVVDYESKSKNLLQQSSITPSINGAVGAGHAISGQNVSPSLFIDREVAKGADSLFEDLDASLKKSNVNRQIASDQNAINNAGEKLKIETNLNPKMVKNFALSDFTSAFSNSWGTTSLNIGKSGSSNGIYNEEFYKKINLALQNPQQLETLHLTNEQMQEYQNQKNYFDSLTAKGHSSLDVRAPASGVLNFDIKTSSPVADKELNLFDIISLRYAKKFEMK